VKVTEIEKVIQQVTEMLMNRLPAADYQLAWMDEKASYPTTLFAERSMVDWIETQDPTKSDGLVVQHVSFPQLAAIAQLLPTDRKTVSILSFLFAGKPVLVLQTESVNSPNKMKYHLKKKITESTVQCQRYGMYSVQMTMTASCTLPMWFLVLEDTYQKKRTFVKAKQLLT